MRTKKAIINSAVNLISFLLIFLPNLLVRKLFLSSLGNQLLGLNSLYNNIIGWLSIIELGVGSAIIFSLYKPYAEDNRKKVREYMSFYKEFYKKIGFLILIIGFFITPFLKFLIHENINIKIATFGFILFLINTFLSYMFSSKLCILNVAQESYKITIATTITKLLTIIFQCLLLLIRPNFIWYIYIQIFLNLIYYITINFYINKRFEWINHGNEKLDKKEKKELIKNVKAMFMHKIGSLVINSTDNIVISKFIGLGVLANYTNYQIIILACQNLVNMIFNGMTASIGNLLNSEQKDKAYSIHKNIFFMNFWIASFIVISLYNTLNQFVVIWFGKEYMLDSFTFNIILINLYFVMMRISVEQFQCGSGNFHQDRYGPMCEAIINLLFSILLAKYIGIAGVFIGTLISNFAVIFWTKPYVVYKYVFKVNVRKYFFMYIKYLSVAILPFILTNFFCGKIKYDYNLNSFFINCIINIIIINLLYIIIFYKKKEFRYFINLILYRKK
ncbi:lipopolysaccharide biosynthesis protein [Clostridium perfringens]